MNIEQIEAEWEKDCKIDQTRLVTQSLGISELHSKYYKIYLREKMHLIGLQSQHKELNSLKYDYYSGHLGPETLRERGWDQFQVRLLKNDIPIYLDKDKDLVTSSLKIDIQREKVAMVNSILEVIIKGRGFQIKNAIDMIKFENGAG